MGALHAKPRRRSRCQASTRGRGLRPVRHDNPRGCLARPVLDDSHDVRRRRCRQPTTRNLRQSQRKTSESKVAAHRRFGAPRCARSVAMVAGHRLVELRRAFCARKVLSVRKRGWVGLIGAVALAGCAAWLWTRSSSDGPLADPCQMLTIHQIADEVGVEIGPGTKRPASPTVRQDAYTRPAAPAGTFRSG